MLSRDVLIRELRSQSGNLSTLILIYLVLVGTMIGTAMLIM